MGQAMKKDDEYMSETLSMYTDDDDYTLPCGDDLEPYIEDDDDATSMWSASFSDPLRVYHPRSSMMSRVSFHLPRDTDPLKPVYEAWTLYLHPDTEEITEGTRVLGLKADHDYEHIRGFATAVRPSTTYTQVDLARMHLGAVAGFHSSAGGGPGGSGGCLPLGRLLRRKLRREKTYDSDLDERIRGLDQRLQDELAILLGQRSDWSSTPTRQREWCVVAMEEQLHHRFVGTGNPPPAARRHRFRWWKDNVRRANRAGQKERRTEHLVIIMGRETCHDKAGIPCQWRNANPWSDVDREQARLERKAAVLEAGFYSSEDEDGDERDYGRHRHFPPPSLRRRPAPPPVARRTGVRFEPVYAPPPPPPPADAAPAACPMPFPPPAFPAVPPPPPPPPLPFSSHHHWPMSLPPFRSGCAPFPSHPPPPPPSAMPCPPVYAPTMMMGGHPPAAPPLGPPASISMPASWMYTRQPQPSLFFPPGPPPSLSWPPSPQSYRYHSPPGTAGSASRPPPPPMANPFSTLTTPSSLGSMPVPMFGPMPSPPPVKGPHSAAAAAAAAVRSVSPAVSDQSCYSPSPPPPPPPPAPVVVSSSSASTPPLPPLLRRTRSSDGCSARAGDAAATEEAKSLARDKPPPVGAGKAAEGCEGGMFDHFFR